MSRMILARPHLADEGTLLANTEEAEFPATNLQDLQPTTIWRSEIIATVFLTLDLGAALDFDTVALLAHNGSADAQWRIRAADSEANLTAGPSYDSGLVSMWPASGKPDEAWDNGLPSLHRLPATETQRWLRIDIDDTANAAGYFQAGRLIVDAAWQPSINMQYGWSLGWEDASIVTEGLWGQRWFDARARRRVAGFDLAFLDQDEMLANAFELDRRLGVSGDLLFVFDPDDDEHLHRRMVHGTLAELAPIVNPAFEIFERRFAIRELI